MLQKAKHLLSYHLPAQQANARHSIAGNLTAVAARLWLAH
jgi:hypothetical protein